MNYSFWNDKHTIKTEINLQVNSSWKKLVSEVDNKNFTSIWKMVDNGDEIIQQNELDLFKKLCLVADGLIDATKDNDIIEDKEAKKLIKLLKKEKSQIAKKQGWSEGINRQIKTIQIIKKDNCNNEALQIVIKELKAIGKQVGFKVQTSDVYDFWHEDGSILLHDGTRYFPILDRKKKLGYVNDAKYGVRYKRTIPNIDIVQGKSYLEGGNVLNTRLADGTPAAVIGEESIHFTLEAMYGNFFEEYINIAKKQIAKDLHLKEENITYVPQSLYHIDMIFRPLQDGVIAIPDFEKGIKIVKENFDDENFQDEFGQVNESMYSDIRDLKNGKDLDDKYQKEINTIAEAEQRLINSGYKVVKIPYFGKTGDNSACYMNGIAGTSNNKKNETYYITNSSGSKKLDNIMTEYFKKAGFDKVFFVSTSKFVKYLDGGIDCLTQEM